MRLSFTVLALAVTLPLAAQQKKPATSTTAHPRPRTAATAKAKPAPEPGLAAVGEMPAVMGKAETLFALKYVDLVVGTGELAKPRQFYTVAYTGWTTDGKKFDSSHDHPGGAPIIFPVGARQVITGWDTGFEGMHVGGKRRLMVPYQLAYGAAGRAPVIPEKATLIFDVELLGQSDTPPAPVGPPPAENKPADKPADAPASTTAPATTAPATTPAPATTTPAPQK